MKEKIVWIFVVLYLCSFHLNAQNAENNPTGVGLPIREPCIMKTRREL